MTEPARFSIVRPGERHRADWDALYAGYAAFYASAQSVAMRERVWGWLNDPDHELAGFVAEADAKGIGLAHYRPFVRPLAASVGGYIDDLFVAPGWRGTGVAEAVATEGRRRGWSVIRWITAEDNHRARRFYDRIARRTHWVTYQMALD